MLFEVCNFPAQIPVISVVAYIIDTYGSIKCIARNAIQTVKTLELPERADELVFQQEVPKQKLNG